MNMKMKHKKTELDIDFIGGVGSLTKEEEKIISEFLKRKKLCIPKSDIRKTRKHIIKKSHIGSKRNSV